MHLLYKSSAEYSSIRLVRDGRITSKLMGIITRPNMDSMI